MQLRLNVIGQNNGRIGKAQNSSIIGSTQSEISNDDDYSPRRGKRRNTNVEESSRPTNIQSNVSNNLTTASTPSAMEFPNGKSNLNFDEFIDIINESCSDSSRAENFLIVAFSMFDREK